MILRKIPTSHSLSHHEHSLSRSSFSLKSCSRDSWLLLFSQSSAGTWAASDLVDLVVLFFLSVLGEGLPATEAVGFDFFWKFIFDHPGRWVVILQSPFHSPSDHHQLLIGNGQLLDNYCSTIGHLLAMVNFCSSGLPTIFDHFVFNG